MTVTKLPVKVIFFATVCYLSSIVVLANTRSSEFQALIDNRLNPVQTFFSLPIDLTGISSISTELSVDLGNNPGHENFERSLYSAINSRLGRRYIYGSEGGRGFDCSGFVWNVFQSIGVTFNRTSARSMWSAFPTVVKTDKYKFGTLVFFNRLHHVGIVVDEHGFYHASRRHGVVYAQFNKYWKRRIVGFRQIPLNAI